MRVACLVFGCGQAPLRGQQPESLRLCRRLCRRIGYFRTGNADREFNKMEGFVVKSLRRWQYRRGGQRPTKRAPFTGDQLYGMGLHKLMGTVKYPAQATPRRSSLSRVPENGTHGLKGEIRNGLA